MKVGLLRVLAGAVSLALAAAPLPSLAQDKVVLKMGTLGTTDYYYYKGAKKMADDIGQKTGGRVEVQVFPNQELGNERDMIEGMQLGTVDLAIINTALLAGFESRFMVFDMPFMFNDWAHVSRVVSGPVGQELMKSVESRGLKAFAFSTAGFRNVLNNRREVKALADLKGLKIRTLDNPVHVAIMNAMGANATPMQYGEVANGLRMGTIDGLDFQVAASATEKMYETNKYMTLTGHVFTAVIYLMSLKRYEALPPDLQKAIAEGAVDGANTETELYNAADVQAIETLKSHGMVIDTVDKAPFRAATQTVYDKFQDRIGKDLIAKVRELGQ